MFYVKALIMTNWILLGTTLFCLVCVICAAEEGPGKALAPLKMEVEWILQGNTIGFTGFFCELLGFSSAFRELFPYMRVIKSSFIESVREPHFGGKVPTPAKIKDIFKNQLLPKESENLLSLSFPTLTAEFSTTDAETCITCLSTAKVEKDTALVGGDMTKTFVPGALSEAACCHVCEEDPLCVAWTFGPEFLGEFAFTIGPASRTLDKCMLKTSLPMEEDTGKMLNGNSFSIGRPNAVTRKQRKGFTSGLLPAKRLAPRALVFHGTMCLYRNESVHTYERDINTIYIGRYMVERPEFPGGFNQDEYLVFSCAARMDEIWVPTEWHRTIFANTLTSMGIPFSGRLFVIPEAVDSELFDPQRVRSTQEGNRFGIRSHLPADGCTVTTSEGAKKVECGESGSFRFLSIFKWEHRKGWDILLDAYWATFTPADDVVLILRTYVPSFSKLHPNITFHLEDYALEKFQKPLHELARVEWESGMDATKRSDSMTRADVRDLLGSVDSFVLPTRGEGWGLPIAEAMSMSLPVVVTNATGVLAYARDDNAYLIPVAAQLDQMAFVQPDVIALKRILQEVIQDAGPAGDGRAQRKGARAREMMEELSPAYVGGLISHRLASEARRRGWNV